MRQTPPLLCRYICIYIHVAVLHFLDERSLSLPIAHANHPSRERFIACTNYDNRSRHQTMWNVAPTKNVHHANKMTDIVNYVFRCP